MKHKITFRLALAGALLLAAPANAFAAGDLVVHRDPGCSCCGVWANQIAKQLGRKATISDNPNRAALVQRLGVPPSLGSCHTAIIDGVVVEGHIPAADIKRFLGARPKGMKGIAVGGMPLGSPGMEVPGRRPHPYSVMAFGPGKQALFAKH
jgi:hypothetical protein